jgi:hypothetical protein
VHFGTRDDKSQAVNTVMSDCATKEKTEPSRGGRDGRVVEGLNARLRRQIVFTVLVDL